MLKRPFKPSRAYPHPWCPVAHLIPAPAAFFALGRLISAGVSFVAVLGVVGAFIVLVALVLRREFAIRAADKEHGIIVHEDWAFCAALADILFIVATYALLWAVLTTPKPLQPETWSTTDLVISLFAGGVTVFDWYTHRKAVQRAPMPTAET